MSGNTGQEVFENAGKTVIFVLLCMIASPVFGETEVAMSLDSFYGVRHLQKNSTINQNDEMSDQGGVKLNFHITPVFDYQENFQFDYLVDIDTLKRFETDGVDINFNETYIDFLFYQKFGIKTGIIAIDYGSNSYFHPLQVVEFIPELKARYGRQFFGSTDLGYRGVPSFQAKLKLPSFNENANITLRQSEIFLGADLNTSSGNVQVNAPESVVAPSVIDRKVYSITDVSFVYKTFDLALLAGYVDRKRPVWGGSISFLFPFEIMGYAEVLYRKESFRAKIKNGEYLEWEKGNYYNASLGASASFSDPFLQNTIKLECELFYYAEGYDGKQFSEVRDFLQYRENYAYYDNLIQKERNFKRNGMLSVTYTIPRYRLSFQEKATGSVYTRTEPGSRYRYLAANEFYISKAYNSATITFGYLYNTSISSDSFVYQGNDKSFIFSAGIVF